MADDDRRINVNLTPEQLAQLQRSTVSPVRLTWRPKRESILLMGGVFQMLAGVVMGLVFALGISVGVDGVTMAALIGTILASGASWAGIGTYHRVQREGQRMKLDGYDESPQQIESFAGDPTDPHYGPPSE